MRDGNGAARGGALWAVVVLAIALVVVVILWQRDRESKDLEIDIGRSAPERVERVA